MFIARTALPLIMTLSHQAIATVTLKPLVLLARLGWRGRPIVHGYFS